MPASALAIRQTPKAYDLLVSQPVSATGLSRLERAEIVISAVADADGGEHVLSRFGDATWDLRPYFEQSNIAECFKLIEWPADCPASLVDDCKAALYAWFKRGLPGAKRPVARGVCMAAIASAIPLMRWLGGLRIERFDQVRPIHISNFLHLSKVEMKLRPLTVYNRLRILEFLWVFRQETLHPLTQCPWGQNTLWRLSGLGVFKGFEAAARGTGRTPIIPPEVQSKVFNLCEMVIAGAHALLDERDAKNLGLRNPRLIRIRDAALYILSITSGMRNEEAIGVEVDSWRKEVKDGIEYHWVATIEHKTGKGKVEYLVPALTIEALDVMRRYAEPLQHLLAKELAELKDNAPPDRIQEWLIRQDKAKRDSRKLFLCLNGLGNKQTGTAHVEALSGAGSAKAFRRLSQAAGTDWELLPHQCRRTYARCIVESRMGRASLVFLKWQLKHSSMSMTQLYASNPRQDAAIFDEIMQEMTAFKAELIESWLDERPLAGGAGRQIMRLRAIPFESRSVLLAQTAPQVRIRATGHGWCLAQEKGCGGAGLYEATRCVDCKNSVIDESFVSTWHGIYEQQRELLDVEDVGPAVWQRAEGDLLLARQVLADLGVPPMEPGARTMKGTE